MNDEYKEKLLKQFEQLQTTSEEVEKIIDLLKDSNTLDFDTRAKATQSSTCGAGSIRTALKIYARRSGIYQEY